MSSLLNLENLQELRDLCSELKPPPYASLNPSAVRWRLAPDEVRQLLLSRSDFEATEDPNE